MTLQWNPLIIPLLIAGLTSIYLIFPLRKRIPKLGTKSLIASLIFSAFWTLTYALELSSTGLIWMSLWDFIQEASALFIPLFYLLFIVETFGKEKWMNSRNLFFLCTSSAFVIVMMVNDFININDKYFIIQHQTNTYLIQPVGAGYWVLIIHSLLLILIAEAILINAIKRSLFLFRGFITIMMVVGLVPIMLSLLDIFDKSPILYFSPTGLVTTLTIIVLVINLENIQAGDLAMISRGLLFQDFADGAIFLDEKNRIADINPIALKMLGRQRDEVRWQPISQVWSIWAQVQSQLEEEKSSDKQVVQVIGDRYINVGINELQDWRDYSIGKIIILKDITNYQQRVEELSALLEISNAVSETLDLDQVLLRLSNRLLDISGMHICHIFEFDQEKNVSRKLAKISRPYWFNVDDFTSLEDYPSTRQVVEDGEPLIIRQGDDDPGSSCLTEMNFGVTVLFPLRNHEEIVGLVEVCALDRYTNVTEESMETIGELLNQASELIEFPLDRSNSDHLLSLPSSIVHSSWGEHCSISFWNKEGGFIRTITAYSEMLWNLGEGPKLEFNDWPAAFDAHQEQQSSIVKSSDSNKEGFDIAELDVWGAKMMVSIPISIRGELLGGIQLFQMTEERSVEEEEFRLWKGIADQATIMIQNSKLYQEAQIEIDYRKKAEERLTYDAYHDSLTELPNRVLLLDRLDQALARYKRNPDYRFAVLYMDIDNFKSVNDNYGHSVGDLFLKQFANRLDQQMRFSDTVARFGGDEFLVLIDGFPEIHLVTQIADRIIKRVGTPYDLEGVNISTSVSIGVVIGDEHYLEAEEILRDADIAMYRAKTQGKGNYEIFNPQMRTRILERMQLESDLQNAVETQSFCLNYQPIIDLKSGRVMGYESLLRWKLADGSIISPASFLPLAEENGMIIPIGDWVLKTVCEQIHTWQQENHPEMKIPSSVNISPVQLFSSHFVEKVEHYIRSQNIPGESICFEILESTIIKDIEIAVKVIRELKELGIQIHLDDFGKGHSSLSYLNELPLDKIKIDKFFTAQLSEARVQNLVRFIVEMAHNIGAEVIGEGIESEEQGEFLSSIECDFGQGFLYSYPLFANDFEKFMRDCESELKISSVN